MTKIILTKKVLNEEEFELGEAEEGEFILIEIKMKKSLKDKLKYRLGKFSKILEDNGKRLIEFKDAESYRVGIKKIYGSEIPVISEVPYTRWKSDRYFNLIRIKRMISGKENIVDYFEKEAQKEYAVFADIIRKMQ